MQIKGGKQLQERYRKAMQQLPVYTSAALLDAGNHIINESKKLTPVDTGNLRVNQSARLIDKQTVLLEVKSEYALYVHENLEQKLKGQKRPHPKKGEYWETGEPRFLAKAMQRNFKAVMQKLTKSTKETLEK